MQKRPVEDRFFEKIKDTGNHWFWAAFRNPCGYGMIRDSGRMKLAHRVSWEIHFGPIPNGLEVCHHCDLPACVRPACLFLGTRKDNMQDMAIKNRHAHRNKTQCPQGHTYNRRDKYQRYCTTCKAESARKRRNQLRRTS